MTTNDILGMVIAITAVVITIMSVYVAFLLSRNYLDSIRQMDEIRKISSSLEEQVQAVTEMNSLLLRESMLTVRTIFDLVMLHDRIQSFRKLIEDLRTVKEWKGRSVSDSEADSYIAKVKTEIAQVQLTVTARETELYWLIGTAHEKIAHLHALTTTKGDVRTIALLESVRSSRAAADDKEDLLVAISALRQRLGKPARQRRRNLSNY